MATLANAVIVTLGSVNEYSCRFGEEEEDFA